MAVGEQAPDNWGGLDRDVVVDQEERRLDLFASQHIEKVWRRTRIGTVVVCQVDRVRFVPWHVPDGSVAGHRVEDESGRRGVGEGDDPETEEDK